MKSDWEKIAKTYLERYGLGGKTLTFENKTLEVYTDGACTANGKKEARGGVGVFWGPGHELNVGSKLVLKPGDTATNNKAEITACIVAVAAARKFSVGKLILITDSKFVINCITQWISKWKRSGWVTSTGLPVKNKELLVHLDILCCGFPMEWRHVRGHAGNLGNEFADKLAKKSLS